MDSAAYAQLKRPKATTITSEWLTSDRGRCPFITIVCRLFFPLAKKKEKKKTATPGKVIGLPLLFHKLGLVMWKKIADNQRMICGKWRQIREKTMGEKKREI